MKQTIGLLLMLVWMVLFILGAAEPTVSEYTSSEPTWIGWAYIIVLLGAPFIAINLILNDKK